MCAVSMVTDDWTRKHFPNIQPWSLPPTIATPTRQEFEELRKELEELKRLLKEARAKDIEEGAKDCDMKENIEFIRDLAEKLGVDLEDVFDGHRDA